MTVENVNFNPTSAIANIKIAITADVETYCKCECGKEYHSAEAKYCGNCGRKLTKDAE